METTPLISLSGYRNEKKKWINCSDDSSSGYESTDTWDTESVSSRDSDDFSIATSCDIEEDLARSCSTKTEEVMMFCNSAALCDDMKLILAMPDMCDVTFLVGSEEIPVHGLKAVLSVRSRVFQHLIFKHLHTAKEKKDKKSSKSIKKKQPGLFSQNRLEIPVHKYDADVFRMLVQFLHSGTVFITRQNVSGLLCGAVQFELPELADACWEFIENCLVAGCGESLLVPTRAYSDHETSRQIFDKIYAVLDRRFLSRNEVEKRTRKESAV